MLRGKTVCLRTEFFFMSQENIGLVNLLYVNFVLNISIPHEKKLRFSALNACTRILYVVV